jgi:hypothetical protein
MIPVLKRVLEALAYPGCGNVCDIPTDEKEGYDFSSIWKFKIIYEFLELE